MKKKLVLFTSEFPYGQQETFLENELQYLSHSFDQVDIVPLFKHHRQRKLKYKNINVYTPINNSRDVTIHKFVLFLSITFWKTLFLGLIEVKWNPSFYLKVLKQAFIIARTRKYLRKRTELYDASLWYFYWGTNTVNVLSFLKKIPKSIARFHRYDLYGKDIPGGEIQLFQKRTLNKLTKIITISDHGKEYIREKHNEFDHKILTSRLGVPFRNLAKPSTDNVFRIVTCSNFYSVKRVDLLAKALKQIDEINIQWTHIGDGTASVRKKVFKIVDELPANIKFKHLGRISNEQTMEFYRDNPVDLFINVSLSEGLPVSIMEALSFGIPVIATDVGGTAELVSKSNGALLDKYFEVSELSQAIRTLYKNHFKDQEIRERAFMSWKEIAFSEVNYVDFIIELYKILGIEQDMQVLVESSEVQPTFKFH